MKYIKGFDSIRAIAVIIVIIGHWGLPFAPKGALDEVITSVVQFGRFGVTMFFVLSGFLITSILLHEKEKHDHSARLVSVKNFFARRVLRIFPIYYLFIFLILLTGDPYVRSHIWYYLGYSSNLLRNKNDLSLPHFWTLAIEEQFYLIWPWLILFVNKKYTRYIFIVSILLGTISQYISYNWLHLPYGYIAVNCFDSFGLGALYAWMRLDKENCRKFEQSFRLVFPVLLFAVWKITPMSGMPVAVIFIRFVDNIISLALIMFAINNTNEFARKYLLENRVLNFIGKISYGIYIYHFSFGYGYLRLMNGISQKLPALSKILLNDYFFYFTKFGCLILVSWLSYKLIEQPIMRLKHKFEYK